MLDHVTIGSDNPKITGSAATVETTLGNIVNNAIQALGEVDKEDKYIRIKSRASIRTIVRNKNLFYLNI